METHWHSEPPVAVVVRTMRAARERALRAARWYTAKLIALAIAPFILAALIILNAIGD